MAITQDEFRKEVDDLLRERNPSLTSKQRAALVDAVIQKEEAGGGTIRLWDYDSAFRLEHLGYMLFNLEHANPEMFAPPPSIEQTFAAKLAALHEEFGDDKSHPFHPDRPSVRRDLKRQIEKMDGDARAAFVQGLKIPAAETVEPDRNVRDTESAPTFDGPGDPRFRAYVEDTFGIPKHKQLSSQNATYYRAHVASLRDKERERAKQIVQEAGAKATLSLAEQRTLARAKSKLAGVR